MTLAVTITGRQSAMEGVGAADPSARGALVRSSAVVGSAQASRWDASRAAAEVEVYLARVRAERQSQEQPDDLAADAARLLAPDTRKVSVGRALR